MVGRFYVAFVVEIANFGSGYNFCPLLFFGSQNSDIKLGAFIGRDSVRNFVSVFKLYADADWPDPVFCKKEPAGGYGN